MKNLINIILILFFVASCNSQNEKVLIHEFSPTASSWNVEKWNSDKKLTGYQIRESVDSKNRVVKLEFMKNGKVLENRLCYLPTVVEYEYQAEKIIENLYANGERMEATECEMPYKTVYHLKNNYIEKVERFSKFDTINFSKEEITELKKYVPEYNLTVCNDSMNCEIEFYYHSFAKMDGIYPVNKNYKYDSENYYYGDEPEAETILNGIKKLKN